MTMMENSLVYNTQTLGSMSKSDPFTGALIPPDHHHHHLTGNQVQMVQNHNSAGSKLKLQLSAPLTHSLVMSTKQQVNGTSHHHITTPAPTNTTTETSPSSMSPPSPIKPSSMSPGSPIVANLPPSILSVGKTTNNVPAKKIQIIETPSFENKINDLAQETSGEETVEAETSETESKFSSDDEENDDSSLTPPEDYVEHVEGYEMVSFETVVVPPPPNDDSDNEKDEKIRELVDDPPCYAEPQVIVKITEDLARGCLLDHVSSHVCYGREAAKSMVITDMEYVPALHYELQTFTERRETCWSYAPHRPDNNAAVEVSMGTTTPPLPWEVDQHPVRMFRDEVRLVTVPHTGVVKTCHKCRGTGGMTCGDCGGKGWVRCLHCHGDVHLEHGDGAGGSMDRDRCYYCQHSKHGHGHLECSKCKARGKVSCATCEGTTNILCFIQLSISWRINTSEHITEKLDIPDDLIRDVSGQVAFEEENIRVCPVEAFDDEVIKMASAQLVASHSGKFPEEKILKQRHQVRVVPVTKVNYQWKGKTRSFFVYGYENKVYVPNNSYPQSCCWGCNLM